jgi:hypothetical protein
VLSMRYSRLKDKSEDSHSEELVHEYMGSGRDYLVKREAESTVTCENDGHWPIFYFAKITMKHISLFELLNMKAVLSSLER